MTNLYDVIIIGAGPGGATAAYFLGEAGRRVLVLEKEALPRYKACGGGLSTEMLEKVFPFSFESVIEARIQTVGYTLGERRVSVPVPQQSIRTVMRDRFDAHLLAHAKAEVRPGVAVRRVTEAADRVIVETADGARYEGRYLIGADGAKSVVARDLKLRRNRMVAAALEAEVRVAPEVQRRLGSELLFIFGEIRDGYAWVFPKAAHLSVGIAAVRPRPGELQATLKRLADRYGIALEGADVHGHPIPLYTRRDPLVTPRSLLVGDAAGLADPFSGEGIRLAIKSGRLAAQAILSGRIAHYPEDIFREIGINHMVGRGVAWLFFHFTRLCFELGVRNPFATRACMDMLADRAGYVEVLARIFGTLPIFLLTEAVAGVTGVFGGAKRREQIRANVYAGG